VDGDSLEIHGIAIRIHGIDAPESGQWCSRDQIAYRCGQEAAFALADKIGLKVVSCLRRDTDRYGRMVAVCTAGGEDLGGWLVSQGYAIAFRRDSLEYVATEERAREAKRGLWVGEFEKPEDFGDRAGSPRGSSKRHPCGMLVSVRVMLTPLAGGAVTGAPSRGKVALARCAAVESS
jgi:endonuclease YncB( thermonuclease family)